MKRQLLTTKNFETILKDYNVGSFRRKHFIDITIENQNYKLLTTKGTYLLKFFDNENLGDLLFKNKLIEHLHDNKVKVPRIIYNRYKSSVTKFGNKYLSVYQFMEGEHLKTLSTKLCKDLAKQIAIMHIALLKYKPKDVGRKLTFYTDKETWLTKNKKIRKTFIHGDLGRLNILKKGDKVNVIVDFGDARWDLLAKDLAVFCTIFIDKNQKKYLPLFFNEYQKYIKLSKEELDAIPYLIQTHAKAVLKWLNKQLQNKQTLSHRRHIEKALKRYNAIHQGVNIVKEVVK